VTSIKTNPATFHVSRALWPQQDIIEQKNIIFSIREQVFVIEQSVDADIEWDGRDHLCRHVIAYSNDNKPIGTGRLLPGGHIGRIAVIALWRDKGVGSAILEELISIAKDEGSESVYLNSQSQAIAFYERFDFVADGAVFMEANIIHQKMILPFKRKLES